MLQNDAVLQLFADPERRRKSALAGLANMRRSSRRLSLITSRDFSKRATVKDEKQIDVINQFDREVKEIISTAQFEKDKDTDIYTQVQDMKNRTKRSKSKLKEQSVITWLKKRYKDVAKKEYTNTEAELLRHKEIEDMFLLFDINRSGTLEIDEISKMFTSNGISINKSNLIKLFQMVDKDNSGTLTFAEFKEFMLNETRQKEFTELMKKERSQQINETQQNQSRDSVS